MKCQRYIVAILVNCAYFCASEYYSHIRNVCDRIQAVTVLLVVFYR